MLDVDLDDFDGEDFLGVDFDGALFDEVDFDEALFDEVVEALLFGAARGVDGLRAAPEARPPGRAELPGVEGRRLAGTGRLSP